MRTRREPIGDPNPNQGSTHGVRYLFRPDRPNPYGVQWPERVFDPAIGREVRKVKTLFFPTEESRETKAVELRGARRSRMVVASVSRSEIEEWRAFKAAIGETPWQDVVAGWRSRQIERGVAPCTLTVSKAATTYISQAKKQVDANKMSGDYFRHLNSKMKAFVEQFGEMALDQVRAADIVEWIEDMDEVVSDFTFDNYKKHIRAFFSYFISQEQPVIRDNPGVKIRNRSSGIGEVGIISVAQTAQLFWTALNYGNGKFKPMIGRLAFEAFLGLRFASACRLEKKDISFADKGVLLPAKKLKTKRRHYLDGIPAQIWDWLAVTPEECWSLNRRNYMRLKSDLFTVAQVPHPPNCLRHGFATYDVAANKNAGKTAYFLCHADQDELYEHYKGNATESDGKLYQSITPQTVAELRKGFEPAVQRAQDEE